MNVLVGCEESQAVTIAFRELGHEAYSCDLQPCSGGHPEWHIQGDIVDTIKYLLQVKFDLFILHPDCTALSLSGNRWYGKGKPYHYKRLESIEWTVNLWNLAKEHCDRVALENPTSVIFKHLDAPVQYIQPYQFGHGETKKTGLALYNLPELKPTNEVNGREQRIWKMSPSPDRKKLRSKTFPGIAQAMAEQWGIY